MGFVTAGPVGYPDGQRVSNWDPDEAFFTLAGAQAGPFRSAIMPVPRFGYLTGWAGVLVNPIRLAGLWFLDAAGAQQTGLRRQTLGIGPDHPAQIHWSNFGPFVQFQVDTVNPGDLWTPDIKLTQTNRTGSTLLAPDSAIIEYKVWNLAAGQSVAQSASEYWAGRFSAYVNGGSQGVRIQLQFFNIVDGWIEFTDYNVPANTKDYRELLAPQSPVQYVITNLSGAAANATASVLLLADVSSSG